MREDSRKTGQEHHEPAAPSRERRLLLKAAATAAPIIATLPNGAALANASAADCVVKDKALSDAGGAPPVNSPPPPADGPSDAFVRYSAWQRICGVDVYYYVYAPSGAQWYKADGTVAIPTCGSPTPPDSRAGDKKVYVLTYWIPEDDFNGVHPDGFYPVTNLDDANMGITASCLCSVDAGYLSEPWCKA